jgi:signal transduction histidine kinase
MKRAFQPKDLRLPVPAPRAFILAVVGVLCLAILGSALFTYETLTRMRVEYLSNRGHAIASAIEARARGPGRRNNPAFWQSLLEEAYETHAGSVSYLALIDQDGRTLAGAGELPPGSSITAANTDDDVYKNDVYKFEESLPQSRNPRNEPSPAVAGWRMQIGLFSADADFIQKQAFWQLAVSGLAVIVLLALSIHLIRMLNRYLELKEREGAEAQLKSLGIMAASLAHEIRNPLGAMKGLTQLAKEDLPHDHEAQGQLDTVVSEAERLEQLVTDLLDFARPKAPQVNEFDLMGLLSKVKDMLQSKLEPAKVELQFTAKAGPLMILSDPRGLRQVLFNVLINAIDASPPAGKVVLSVISSETDRSIIIQVDDSGLGPGEMNSDDVFQPFVTTKVRGTGLGLAVSRQIVESLHGTITLGHNPQGGGRCTIQLPQKNR